jgi:hypothetical protein
LGSPEIKLTAGSRLNTSSQVGGKGEEEVVMLTDWRGGGGGVEMARQQ